MCDHTPLSFRWLMKLLLVAALTTVGSCALPPGPERELDLLSPAAPLPEEWTEEAVSEALSFPSPAATLDADAPRVALRRIVDLRKHPDRVDHVETTTKRKLTGDRLIVEVLSRHLIDLMAAAGYRMILPEEVSRPDAPAIDIFVVEFHVCRAAENWSGWSGSSRVIRSEVTIGVRLVDQDGVRVGEPREFRSRAEETFLPAVQQPRYPHDRYERILNLAYRDCLMQLADYLAEPDVRSHLEGGT